MERPTVVRVTKDEFELSDGTIQPMMFPVEGKVPTVEEFQKVYDGWYETFKTMGLIPEDEQETSGDR